MPTNPLKVRVELVVMVNREQWQRSYGGDSAAAIRDDVRGYITGLVDECSAAEEGCFTLQVAR